MYYCRKKICGILEWKKKKLFLTHYNFTWKYVCNKEGVQSNALSSFLDVHHDFLLFVDGPCSPHIALKIQKNVLQFIATIIKKNAMMWIKTFKRRRFSAWPFDMILKMCESYFSISKALCNQHLSRPSHVTLFLSWFPKS